ncbi:fumarylacetoacetate hydrolase [Phanerochaete sordida]|uniref:Fumarylacetoacetate hydrolase n=1 Tax=Phanerochaete sordida TaxID=48140 RepID=A0A9P3L6X4_9APHY|nr:fumarylacetoacetate hydrolase [Phanerochaete sordida]
MAPIKTAWTRLIRFVAAETSQVHLGEPCDRWLDVGLAFHKKQTIKAYEIVGAALDPAAQVTNNVLTVQHLLPPLTREEIGVVRCLGLNYADHAAEAGLAKPQFPILFYKPPTALIGPDAPIKIPKVTQPVDKHLPDYEVELTIVIGKPAKDVSEEDALDYVLGYTGANDMSFRYHQMAVSQWGFSKGYDDATPIGPCIVSNNAIPDPQRLALKCVLNGKTVQDGSTADQIFTVRQTVAFLSQGTTLLPGSVIMTGTPKGVGFVKKPPLYLKNGDQVTVWVDGGIGSLVNDVIEEGKGGVKARL